MFQNIRGNSFEILEGFITIFILTTCVPMNVSRQGFWSFSNVLALLIKHLPSKIMQETSENKHLKALLVKINSFLGCILPVLGYQSFLIFSGDLSIEFFINYV